MAVKSSRMRAGYIKSKSIKIPPANPICFMKDFPFLSHFLGLYFDENSDLFVLLSACFSGRGVCFFSWTKANAVLLLLLFGRL